MSRAASSLPGSIDDSVDADQLLEVAADGLGLLRVAAGALLDQPFQQRRRERHPGRLEDRQIDRSEQIRRRRALAEGVGKHLGDRPRAGAGRGADGRHRVGRLEKIRHGREGGGDVDDRSVAQGHHARPADRVVVDASDQRGDWGVVGQDLLMILNEVHGMCLHSLSVVVVCVAVTAGVPAVDDEFATAEVAGLVAEQEGHRGGDLGWLGHPVLRG